MNSTGVAVYHPGVELLLPLIDKQQRETTVRELLSSVDEPEQILRIVPWVAEADVPNALARVLDLVRATPQRVEDVQQLLAEDRFDDAARVTIARSVVDSGRLKAIVQAIPRVTGSSQDQLVGEAVAHLERHPLDDAAPQAIAALRWYLPPTAHRALIEATLAAADHLDSPAALHEVLLAFRDVSWLVAADAASLPQQCELALAGCERLSPERSGAVLPTILEVIQMCPVESRALLLRRYIAVSRHPHRQTAFNLAIDLVPLIPGLEDRVTHVRELAKFTREESRSEVLALARGFVDEAWARTELASAAAIGKLTKKAEVLGDLAVMFPELHDDVIQYLDGDLRRSIGQGIVLEPIGVLDAAPALLRPSLTRVVIDAASRAETRSETSASMSWLFTRLALGAAREEAERLLERAREHAATFQGISSFVGELLGPSLMRLAEAGFVEQAMTAARGHADAFERAHLLTWLADVDGVDRQSCLAWALEAARLEPDRDRAIWLFTGIVDQLNATDRAAVVDELLDRISGVENEILAAAMALAATRTTDRAARQQRLEPWISKVLLAEDRDVWRTMFGCPRTYIIESPTDPESQVHRNVVLLYDRELVNSQIIRRGPARLTVLRALRDSLGAVPPAVGYALWSEIARDASSKPRSAILETIRDDIDLIELVAGPGVGTDMCAAITSMLGEGH